MVLYYIMLCIMSINISTEVMEFITTQKGGRALILEGAKFTLNRTVEDGKQYWRCSKRSCPARVTSQGQEISQQAAMHNHPVNRTAVRIEKEKVNMKKRAREETTPVPTIYNDAIVTLSTSEHRSSVVPEMPIYSYHSQVVFVPCSPRAVATPTSVKR